MDVLGLQAVGVRLAEEFRAVCVGFREVAARREELAGLYVDHTYYFRNVFEADVLEYGLFGVEDPGLGMVDHVRGVGGGEAREYLDRHELTHLGRKENLGPVGAALGVDGDAVVFLEPRGFPEQHVGLDFRGEFAVGDA